MIDWKISIGAILALLLSAWLGHRLSVSRTEQQAYREKARQFKELLVPFLKSLEATEAHPATLVSENFPQQDEAARKLVLYMGAGKRRRFLQHWESYEALYQEKSAQGILSLIATEVDDLSKASPGQPGMQQYILEQTAKRRNHVSSLINNAIKVL